MASGCQAWPGFGGAGPNRPAQEVRWIAEINRQWPSLTQTERQRVQLYTNRWGPNARPDNFTIHSEDGLWYKRASDFSFETKLILF